MKRNIILLVAITVLATAVSGKIVRRQLGIYQSTVPETETIAKETMEFVYDYRFCVDTTEIADGNFSNDNMLLQIGADGLSKFSSLRNLTVDSIIAGSTPEQIAAAVYEGKLDNGEFMTIYKNYPSGKLTHTEKVCTDWFRYEEDIPALEWELTDSVINVLGYECHGAKCNFRGREWTAFYSEEIPLADGPWKLQGLPGLIMKASDRNGHYIFECIGIRSKADRPITIYKVSYNNVDRNTYYDTRHRYEVNPYSYFEATTGGHVTVTDGSGNPLPEAYDPVELPYGYIELDWRK